MQAYFDAVNANCSLFVSNRETGALCAMKEVEMFPDDPKSAESIKQLEQVIHIVYEILILQLHSQTLNYMFHNLHSFMLEDSVLEFFYLLILMLLC